MSGIPAEERVIGARRVRSACVDAGKNIKVSGSAQHSAAANAELRPGVDDIAGKDAAHIAVAADAEIGSELGHVCILDVVSASGCRRSLSLELNTEERDKLRRRYTENIEAYQLYNKGRFFWNNRSSEDLRKSIAFYEQAIAIDENYAPAYAGLAENYVLLQLFSQSQEHDYFPKARIAAERALSLDEDLAEARTALASYKQQYEWDWEGAEIEFKRAISANPNYATAHQWYGEFLAFMGRTEESIAEVEKSAELDPLSLSTNTALAFPYLASGQYDLATEKLKLALELEDDFPLALYYLGRCYVGKGLYKEAAAEYQKAIAASGGSSFFASSMIYALVKSGKKKEAEKAFSDITKIGQKVPISRYILARSLAALGNKEKAFEELRKAFQERDVLLIILKFDQNFHEIRDEPRFQALLMKMNL